MNRRNFSLSLISGIAALSLPLATRAAASEWPEGPIRMIVPYAPGGAVDVITRLLADVGSEQWNSNPMLVDNRSGGNTIIGVRALLGSPKDGSTFLVTVQDTLNIPNLMADVPYTAEDLIPVAALTSDQLVLVANPDTFPHDLNWLLHSEEAKQKDFNFASFGAGSDAHFLQYVLAKQSGARIEHIPYRGSVPAVSAVVAGDADMTLTPIAQALPFLKEGKIKALAVTGPRPREGLSEVKTLAEFGVKGFDDYLWIGVFAAAGTPDEFIKAAHEKIRKVTSMPRFQERIQSMHTTASTLNQEEFAKEVHSHTEKTKKLIKESGIRIG